VSTLPVRAPRSARSSAAAIGLQPDSIGARPVWVLPNPSGLNAHYKPPDFARLYAEARAYADTLVEGGCREG
jgi:TDG/mug DNA glycosylase family protein